ncbi:hypothetical protein BVRB_1g017820 [Beta vulgaris subsp. vulgaris]|nr:hypothetical protein BVRB_1g017820 [Beta vulgaris subsp. vulgaris]
MVYHGFIVAFIDILMDILLFGVKQCLDKIFERPSLVC